MLHQDCWILSTANTPLSILSASILISRQFLLLVPIKRYVNIGRCFVRVRRNRITFLLCKIVLLHDRYFSVSVITVSSTIFKCNNWQLDSIICNHNNLELNYFILEFGILSIKSLSQKEYRKKSNVLNFTNLT